MRLSSERMRESTDQLLRQCDVLLQRTYFLTGDWERIHKELHELQTAPNRSGRTNQAAR